MPQIYPAVYVRIDAASGAACGNRLPQSLNSNPTKLALFFSLHPQTYTINKEKKTVKSLAKQDFNASSGKADQNKV